MSCACRLHKSLRGKAGVFCTLTMSLLLCRQRHPVGKRTWQDPKGIPKEGVGEWWRGHGGAALQQLVNVMRMRGP